MSLTSCETQSDNQAHCLIHSVSNQETSRITGVTTLIPKETGESQAQDQSETDNYNFVQVSRNYLKEWRLLMRKSPLASEVLMFLVEHMGRTTNAVVCSYTTLTEATGVSRASVARALKLLKEDNWIDSVKIGNATAYAVNARVFWQAGRHQKQYAIFQATVIASGTEQDSDFKLKAKQSIRHIPFIEENARLMVDNSELLSPPDQQDLDLQ